MFICSYKMIHLILRLSKIINSLLNGISHYPNTEGRWLSGKESACQCRRHEFDPWSGSPPEEEMATHSRILAWRIPWTEEPDRSSVLGISQARVLEWVAISSSRGSSQPRDWTRIFCIGRKVLYCWATWEAHICHESESEVVQSYLTLCDPVDCSSSGSSVHGILQARILEWVAISFSRGSSWPMDRTQVSCITDQIRSLAQSCPTLCDPMNRSTPGLPVHHQIPEFTQTHVHRVSDAIQPSHPLSSPSPPAPNPSQHQSLFPRVNSP